MPVDRQKNVRYNMKMFYKKLSNIAKTMNISFDSEDSCTSVGVHGSFIAT